MGFTEPGKPRNYRVIVQVNEDEYHAITAEARKQDRSRGEIVRRAVQKSLSLEPELPFGFDLIPRRTV